MVASLKVFCLCALLGVISAAILSNTELEQLPEEQARSSLQQAARMRFPAAYKCVRAHRTPRLPARSANRTRLTYARTFHANGKPHPLVHKLRHVVDKQINMENAELYQQSNKLQKRDALQCLQEYENKLQWKSYERILDVGCGDGGVTTEILQKFIPDDFEQMVGSDLSEKMVKYANEHHGDERITFEVMDIAGQVPQHFKENFDHVFSFYTLHWISNQERAFGNIYDMLAEDGECLLIFLGHTPLFDVFRTLAKRPKWRPWLRNVDRFVSPYHDSQDPEKDIRRVMAQKGFQKIHVECKNKSFVYPTLEDCKKAVAAINPFPMPPEVLENFLEDYIQIVKDMRLIESVNNNQEELYNIQANYTLIVAYGMKCSF